MMPRFEVGDRVVWSQAFMSMLTSASQVKYRGQAGTIAECVGRLHDGGGDVYRVDFGGTSQYVLDCNLQGVTP